MAIRVGINGFGRIGRNVVRAAKAMRRQGSRLRRGERHHRHQDARAPAQVRLGSRPLPGRRRGREADALVVDGDSMRVLSEKDPAKLPWKDLGVDVVLESTGRFTDRDQAALHLRAAPRR